jgi:hypothetical protein
MTELQYCINLPARRDVTPISHRYRVAQRKNTQWDYHMPSFPRICPFSFFEPKISVRAGFLNLQKYRLFSVFLILQASAYFSGPQITKFIPTAF